MRGRQANLAPEQQFACHNKNYFLDRREGRKGKAHHTKAALLRKRERKFSVQEVCLRAGLDSSKQGITLAMPPAQYHGGTVLGKAFLEFRSEANQGQANKLLVLPSLDFLF